MTVLNTVLTLIISILAHVIVTKFLGNILLYDEVSDRNTKDLKQNITNAKMKELTTVHTRLFVDKAGKR